MNGRENVGTPKVKNTSKKVTAMIGQLLMSSFSRAAAICISRQGYRWILYYNPLPGQAGTVREWTVNQWNTSGSQSSDL